VSVSFSSTVRVWNYSSSTFSYYRDNQPWRDLNKDASKAIFVFAQTLSAFLFPTQVAPLLPYASALCGERTVSVERLYWTH
ncbi:hypothetical protein J4Q44_G00269540, partial [Coregonus suidteri]